MTAERASTADAARFLAEKGTRTERALRDYLATLKAAPKPLLEAMEYSLLAGGKRLRPALVLGAADIIQGSDEAALPAACALEMIHTYSLVHDDLPAMDNDDLRRGKPTTHKVFGEAMAILAGDALLTMAFDLLARTDDAPLIAMVARAAGVTGMAGGQALDILAEGRSLSRDQLAELHARKTGALIQAAVLAGAHVAGATDDQHAALALYGEHIGLAFQIADDILDVIGEESDIGKPVGSDQAKNKPTYPALIGLTQSRELARDNVRAAVDALRPFGSEADPFRALAYYVVDRDR